MKKITLLVIIMLLLCGCTDENVPDPGLEIYCDEQYGVEYIRDSGLYQGGITVRLDENGNVIHCG